MSVRLCDRIRSLSPLARSLERLEPLAWPSVRIIAGLNLVPHGAQKLFGIAGGSVTGTATLFAKLGLEPAYALAVAVACLEFFGGLLLAVGLGTRVVALLNAGFMMGAILSLHGKLGFFWTDKGYEYPLMWMVVSLALAVKGSGEYSLDKRFARARRPYRS